MEFVPPGSGRASVESTTFAETASKGTHRCGDRFTRCFLTATEWRTIPAPHQINRSRNCEYILRLFENPKPKIEGGEPSECYPLGTVHSFLSLPCAGTLHPQPQSTMVLCIHALIRFTLVWILLNRPVFYLEFLTMDSAQGFEI